MACVIAVGAVLGTFGLVVVSVYTLLNGLDQGRFKGFSRFMDKYFGDSALP